MFSCKICNKAYIGQTSGPMKKRFNNHKNDIRDTKISKEEQKIEIRHFAKRGIDNTKITILKIVPDKLKHLCC